MPHVDCLTAQAHGKLDSSVMITWIQVKVLEMVLNIIMENVPFA